MMETDAKVPHVKMVPNALTRRMDLNAGVFLVSKGTDVTQKSTNAQVHLVYMELVQMT